MLHKQSPLSQTKELDIETGFWIGSLSAL